MVEPIRGDEPSTEQDLSNAGSFSARTVVRVGIRIAIIVALLGFSGWVLFNVFDDLDFDEIRAAIARLSDAEWLALIFGWIVWVVAQGALTASLVHGLPVRRGVLASLGPTAVSSVIPGPSDLPVRYAMFQSWGVSSSEAATAVGASGIFSVSSQLILPSIAGIIILLADVSLGGFLSLIVTASLVLAVLVALAVFLLGSANRMEKAGRKLDRLFRRTLTRFKRTPPEENLGVLLVAKRADAIDHLGDKWLGAAGATIATIATKCALLVMVLRFVGIPGDVLSWLAIFAVYGLVAGLTAVPITPGNAGVTEIGFVGMLTAAAGQEWVNEVTAGVLLYRLLTWILLIPVGLGALGVWRHRLRRFDR